MKGAAGIVLGVVLTILALIIGLCGIVVMIGVGEATNNGLIAIATVSLPFFFLTGLLSCIAPRARWAIAVAMSAPVAILGVLGSWSGAYLLLGAVWTVALALAGAYLGGRLRSPKPPDQNPPEA